jgi:DHA1 family bicyclomycin/chloramphenicol resistance-like MFS transporter
VSRGSIFTCLSVAMFVVPVFQGGHNFWTLSCALWLHMVGYGVQQPCAQVGMAGPFPREAGAASALGGCLLALGAAFCSIWLGSAFDGSAQSIALITGALVAACAVVALTLVQRYGAAPVAEAAVISAPP